MVKVTCEWESLDGVECDDNIFDGIFSEAKLYVPEGTTNLYKAKTPWSNFSSIVEYDVTGINAVHGSDVEIIVKDRTIEVKNVPANCNIKVYSIAGQLIYTGNRNEINIPNGGTFLVKVGDYAKKVYID